MQGPIVSKLCAGLLTAQVFFPGVRQFCVGPNCPPVQQSFQSSVGPTYVDEIPATYDLPMGPTQPSGWVWEAAPVNLVESELLEAPTEDADAAVEVEATVPTSNDNAEVGKGSTQGDPAPAEAKKVVKKQSAATAKAASGRWVYYRPNAPIGGIVARTLTDQAGCGCGCPGCTCGPAVASYGSGGGANYVRTVSYASSGGANYVRAVSHQNGGVYVTRESTFTRRAIFPRLFPRLRGLR